ncbi:MAG: hypothetical protein CMK59_13425 [Proteobacteria bacterium]|nr:hypothetical protein [Pseudomonadota bacterium]
MNDPQWQRETRELIHKNSYWGVNHDEVRLHNGQLRSYHSVTSQDSVLVVPKLKNTHDYVLIRQYRYLQQRWSIEFPGGGSDEGEDLKHAAKRELLEESGCTALELFKLGSFAPCVGIMSETCHVFTAEVERVSTPSFDDWEVGELLVCSAEEIDSHIKNGDLWSGMSITAWALARLF